MEQPRKTDRQPDGGEKEQLVSPLRLLYPFDPPIVGNEQKRVCTSSFQNGMDLT